MKRIYVSTVGRGKEHEESSRVYCVDFDSGEILKSVRLPLAMFDLKNPRGGTRGGRGLAFKNDLKGRLRLYAAGFDGIFKIDPDDMHIEKGWWSRKCQDIHQIYEVDNTLLLTNTLHNKITKFIPEHDSFSTLWDLSQYNEEFGHPPPNPGHPDFLHLNAILWEEKLALICRTGKIINFETGQLVCDNPEYLKGSHDLVKIKNGEICVNNSTARRVVAFNQNWEPRILYQSGPGEGSELAVYGWVRGMSYIEKEDMLLCGNAPAEVLALKNVTSTIEVKKIKISDEIIESVFDIVPHPKDWQ